jgi:hypothetical protein
MWKSPAVSHLTEPKHANVDLSDWRYWSASVHKLLRCAKRSQPFAQNILHADSNPLLKVRSPRDPLQLPRHYERTKKKLTSQNQIYFELRNK